MGVGQATHHPGGSWMAALAQSTRRKLAVATCVGARKCLQGLPGRELDREITLDNPPQARYAQAHQRGLQCERECMAVLSLLIALKAHFDSRSPHVHVP